jgi:hypothetical protein
MENRLGKCEEKRRWGWTDILERPGQGAQGKEEELEDRGRIWGKGLR